jgi:4,4'-diaponeurosporenoate glycosyltransferase
VGSLRAHRLSLAPSGAPGAVDGLRVSVIIPARDEARSLPSLLASLGRQSAPASEVIVVDDGSRDGTGELARASGARVVRVDGPPPGWLGKPWACHQGAMAASGDLLVFLDADVRLAPDALAALVALHGEVGGLVSVQPYHAAAPGAEELSAVFNAAAVLGSGETARWRTRRRRAAFGPCIVTDRLAYHDGGGHAAVRAEIVEDMALARNFAAGGRPVTCRLGGDLVRFRMYPDGFGALLDGWTKNIATGAAGADRAGVLATVAWVASAAFVAASSAAAVVRWLLGGPRPTGAALGWLVTAGTFRAVLRPLGSFRMVWSLLFPIPLACFIGVFARASAIVVTGRTVRWKGREVTNALRVEEGATCA